MFVSSKMSQRQGSAYKTYHAGSILPVMKADELLASTRHQGLLHQLRGMVFIEDEPYEEFYTATLNRFAEFVQVMPTLTNGPLSSLLNDGLARATVAVKDYMASGDTIDPLVMYALFSAALFRDISKVISNHKVILVEETGNFIDVWQPLTRSMVGQAEFYKLYPLAPIYQRLDASLTITLARQLMPESGFLWIASDLQVFADWLDVLSGEDGQGGAVSHGLSVVRRDDICNLINALTQVPVEMKASVDTQYGDQFYSWLKESVASGELAVNEADSGVYVVADGVFLERHKVFHHFAEASKVPVNMNVVFTQFGNLFGIASKGGGDYMNAQYFSEFPTTMNDKGMAFASPLNSRQRSLREGMVLGDPAMVFMNAQIPATTSMLKALQPKTPATHQVPSTQSRNGPSHTQ